MQINKAEQIIALLKDNFSFNEEENALIERMLKEEENLDRIYGILENIVFYKLDKNSVLAFLNYQLFKSNSEQADEICQHFDQETKDMVEDFKVIKDINSLTVSEEVDDIRRMFLVMSKDMRVVMMKLFGIGYDISVLENPLTEKQNLFVEQVKDIHVPLAERLGLDKLKQSLYDNVVRLQFPEDYYDLKRQIESKREENEAQLELSRQKIQGMLNELKIDGEIVSRIKHISSIFNKLHNKKYTLDQIYDILAMRVIVNTVEECYAVLGRIHGIYKPMAGRVKDYIASPKPNGYQSLHTTVIADNQHPMEIQIRTKEMHKASEFGVYAHWLYKENKGKMNGLDARLAWFRETVESAKSMSNQDFIETLKGELYGGVIVCQTPKGKVLEFPEGSTAIDFAYAIHTKIGDYCVGAKINGKLKPLTSQLRNGDIVEIITNQNSKGPSRDWLKVVKTQDARSKIKYFFKNELKEENIKLGKSMFTQALQDKNFTSAQLLTDEAIGELFKKYNCDNLDEIYAGIGSGSISTQSVVNKLVGVFDKTNKVIPEVVKDTLTLKRNKEGVLVDGDSGMLVRFAGCCSPIEGDDIIGYISRGKGVAIHRANCPNIKYLEEERLINATWQIKKDQVFTAIIKVLAEKSDNNIGKITNSITKLKLGIKGFDAKDVGDTFLCTLVLDVKNKEELESAMTAIKGIKNISKVYRGER